MKRRRCLLWVTICVGQLMLLGRVEATVSVDDGQPAAAVSVDASRRDPVELFLLANTAYDSQDWSGATAAYSELVERGLATAAVHFNLGNAQLRNGQLGPAIASFRRARSLAPRDGDLEANLRYARQSAKDAIVPPSPSPVLSTLFFWHYRLSRSELMVLALVLHLLFWTVVTVRIYRPLAESLKWLAVLLAVALVVIGGSWLTHTYFDPTVAVIVPPEVDAYTAPDAGSTVRFKLHAGAEVRVEDERADWIRIGLPDGQQGWVERSWVELTTG